MAVPMVGTPKPRRFVLLGRQGSTPYYFSASGTEKKSGKRVAQFKIVSYLSCWLSTSSNLLCFQKIFFTYKSWMQTIKNSIISVFFRALPNEKKYLADPSMIPK